MQVFIAIFTTRNHHHDWDYNGKNEHWTTVQVRISLILAATAEEATARAYEILGCMCENERTYTTFEIGAPGELITVGEFREG